MKRLFLILFAFFALFSYTLAKPTYTESGIAYKVIDEQTAIICARERDSITVSTDSTLIIPSHVVLNGKEYKVKGIEKEAYAKCYWIKHVIICEGVEEIQYAAFEACTNLVDVVIPSSVKTLGTNVFSFCLNLSSIRVNKKNTYYDSRENCNAIIRKSDNTLIYGCKDTKIPASVKRIKEFAFHGNLIMSAEIPEGLKVIGEYAFCECPFLKQVKISSTVETIDASAFYYCSNISSIIVDDNNKTFDSRNNCNAIIDKDAEKLILGCSSTIIPAGVSEIGESAFLGSAGLQSIDIPEGITTIHDCAFYRCSALKRVTLPTSLTSFEGHTNFGRCVSLESIVIPPIVRSLPNDIFMGCISLQEIKVDVNNQTYDSRNTCNAIVQTYMNKLIVGCKGSVIVDGVKHIDENAFFNSGITSVHIPASVEDIDSTAFRSCTLLKTITVDKGNRYYESDGTNSVIDKEEGKLILACSNSIFSPKISSIGSYAFANAPDLLILPSGIKSIEDYAFAGCHDLFQIFIPKTVTYIGKFAFRPCSGLTSVTIPSSVTSIGRSVFYSCSGLTSVTIPSSVTSIGYYAFSYCSGLKTLVCDIETPLSVSSDVFIEVNTTNCVLYVPAGCVDAYKAAEVWNTFADIREIDATVAIDNATIKDSNTTDAVYNLRGQKVDGSYKGIVIKNGKKVFVK